MSQRARPVLHGEDRLTLAIRVVVAAAAVSSFGMLLQVGDVQPLLAQMAGQSETGDAVLIAVELAILLYPLLFVLRLAMVALVARGCQVALRCSASSTCSSVVMIAAVAESFRMLASLVSGESGRAMSAVAGSIPDGEWVRPGLADLGWAGVLGVGLAVSSAGPRRPQLLVAGMLLVGRIAFTGLLREYLLA